MANMKGDFSEVTEALGNLAASVARRDPVYPVDSLCDVLNHPMLANIELLLLTERHIDKRSIGVMPSLSIAKCKGSAAEVMDSFRRIYEIVVGVDHAANFQDLQKRRSDTARRSYPTRAQLTRVAAEHGFKKKHFKELRCTILTRNLPSSAKPLLPLIAEVAYALRLSSLNLANESKRITGADWGDFQKLLEESHVGVESPRVLCEYLSHKYGLTATHWFRSSPQDGWTLRDTYALSDMAVEDLVEIPTAALMRFNDQLQFGRPLYGKHGHRYLMIVPFVNPRARVPVDVSRIVCLESRTPFRPYVVRNVLEFQDRYFNEYLQKAQMGHLADIQDWWGAANISEVFEFRREFATLANSTFEKIIALSNAFSATCRIFDPESASLVLLTEVTEDGVQRTASAEKVRAIPLAKVEASVNTQTFLKCEKGRYIYVKNQREDGEFHLRKNSRAEICFPLFFKAARLGTLNFESPVPAGFFETDRQYLTLITNQLMRHLEQRFDANDKYWLSRRAQLEQNVHELSNIIRESAFPVGYRERIAALLNKTSVSTSKPDQPLQRLVEFRDNYLPERTTRIAALGDESEQILSVRLEACRFDLPDPTSLMTDHKMSLLKIIYKNLLDNLCMHCDPERDRLYVDGTTKGAVRITMISQRPFTEHELQNAGVAPIAGCGSHPAGVEDEHSGLLLVGILTRHLGGFMHVKNRDSKPGSIVYLTIP